jgi:hypothetical protein
MIIENKIVECAQAQVLLEIAGPTLGFAIRVVENFVFID